MIRALLTPLLVVLLCPTLFAQTSRTGGRLENGRYVSPTGLFSVAIPVLPELGGTMDETPNVVTFRDAFLVHASIACFPMDATQRWEHDTRGRKDYLVWFFTNFVQADFQTRFPGARVESAKFLPTVQEGTLLAYNLIPGGTMFADRLVFQRSDAPPVAKRGNLVFVHQRHVFVLSIELGEKVVEGARFTKTVEEEDEILQKRLFDLLGKMEFVTASAAP
jgi:hypothetical protein